MSPILYRAEDQENPNPTLRDQICKDNLIYVAFRLDDSVIRKERKKERSTSRIPVCWTGDGRRGAARRGAARQTLAKASKLQLFPPVG